MSLPVTTREKLIVDTQTIKRKESNQVATKKNCKRRPPEGNKNNCKTENN